MTRSKITVILTILAFALGVMSASTLNFSIDYSRFLSPVAVLVSACIAIYIAVENLEKASEKEKINRTIDYVFRLTSDLPHQEKINENEIYKKLFSQSHKLKNPQNPENGYNILGVIEAVKRLSAEEQEYLSERAGRLEIILVNIKYGFFSEEIIKAHFGSNYILTFWAMFWPYLILQNEGSSRFELSSGLIPNLEEGLFYLLKEYVVGNGDIKNPYPLMREGFGIVDTIELDDVRKRMFPNSVWTSTPEDEESKA
ncbi:DUF4760 domain-containing protein [Microbulbifer sp. ZKSA004]|uniref:DUF4760 domain-containing protein n=1 Tax=unclassified Microbulbifer TaxID=2619833 RepID=UPI00403A02EC